VSAAARPAADAAADDVAPRLDPGGAAAQDADADVDSDSIAANGSVPTGAKSPRSRLRARAAVVGIPSDIDRTAFQAVISDLGRSSAGAAAATTQSLLDDLTSVAGFVTGNLGRMRDVASALGLSSELLTPAGIERFGRDLVQALTSLTVALATRISGEYEEDDFGFDEEFTEALIPLMSLLYDYYWRVDVTGAEHVPASGRALLVSNHAGAGLPFDGAMVKLACWRETQSPRHARLLVLDWLMGLPYMADLMKKTGQVLASSPNATELLQRDQLVAVFPEGVKGMAKPFSQRYNLERFGRGGFVRIALKTGSPIVPVAVVGSEEIYPKIGNMPFVTRLLGVPFVPITPLFPLLGVFGLIPLPSKWNIEFCEPIDVSQYPPEAADDRSFVLELSERIRATIQERLRENLLKRSTPFW
jgi:1-acyl-sn-glycerol-3-phosphate acyltransferase